MTVAGKGVSDPKFNRRNYLIAVIVGTIIVLGIALGVKFGLKKPQYPETKSPTLLVSNNCPSFRKQASDNETVSVYGSLKVTAVDGAETEAFSFVLTTQTDNEKIELIANPEMEKELRAANGLEIKASGKKVACSLLLPYSPSSNSSSIIIVSLPSRSSTLTTIPSISALIYSRTSNRVFVTDSSITSSRVPTSPITDLSSTLSNDIATSTSAPSAVTSSTGTQIIPVASSPSPRPPRKIALVLFGFSNNPSPTGESASQFRDRLFRGKNGQNGISPIFEKYSNGNVKFQGVLDPSQPADVFGWYTLPGKDTDNCNYEDW
jgi:hypothetical protein